MLSRWTPISSQLLATFKISQHNSQQLFVKFSAVVVFVLWTFSHNVCFKFANFAYSSHCAAKFSLLCSVRQKSAAQTIHAPPEVSRQQQRLSQLVKFIVSTNQKCNITTQTLPIVTVLCHLLPAINHCISRLWQPHFRSRTEVCTNVSI